MSDDENTTPDETPEDEAVEETPTFANRAERRAAKGKGKGKTGQAHQHGAGGFTGKGGTFQPPRNYGSRRSG
ncbi:hypothetical protein SAMN05421684_5832 [Asanoa ishikariensis]|uniref:Uncharacterized protein n=1 Tax=Asanoa ishikariensis TaxID=137265 RepID=A0A1H3TK77_9ACTN|nr:hypothetical protein [Asanoa ishikariensis]SDZ50055.1 hypothetical protein SAMN05421684_5832 [Asanoa ishikariensis]